MQIEAVPSMSADCTAAIHQKAIEDQPKRSKERERHTSQKLARVTNLTHEGYAKPLRDDCPFSGAAKISVNNDRVAIGESSVEVVKNGYKDYSKYNCLTPEQARWLWLQEHSPIIKDRS
ncbi:MAG: hypothetical protein ACM3X1_03800 [Ignavibacteriales bacterium]